MPGTQLGVLYGSFHLILTTPCELGIINCLVLQTNSLEKQNNLFKVTKLLSVVGGVSNSALIPKLNLITVLYATFFSVLLASNTHISTK